MKNDPQAGGKGLDEVRQATIDRLCERFAEDRLSMRDFEQRLDLAHRATTTRQLGSLVADLHPGASPPARGGPATSYPASPDRTANVVPREEVPARQFLAGILGASTRGGSWVAPREMYAVALMGGVELDFREAGFGPGVTEVSAFALWGGVDVIVPPGLQVECSGAGIMGGFERKTDELAVASMGSHGPESPVLRVNGVAVMGGVTVSTRLAGESEREANRRRKLARKARRKELRGK